MFLPYLKCSESPAWIKGIADTFFAENDGGFLLLCCLFIPAIILIRAASFVANGYMAYAGFSVIQSIQIDVYKKVQSLPLAFFNKYQTEK